MPATRPSVSGRGRIAPRVGHGQPWVTLALAGLMVGLGLLLHWSVAESQPNGEPRFRDEFGHSSWIDQDMWLFGMPMQWRAVSGTYGAANNELECLEPGSVSVLDGSLSITADRVTTDCAGSRRDFSSGFLSSRDAGKYYPLFGRYEIRAKLPHGQGLWPAFWLRHRDGAGVAEVDVFEYFHSQVPGQVTQTVHLRAARNVAKRSSWFEAPTDAPGWHTFAVDISPAPDDAVAFQFSVDRLPTLSYTSQRAKTWEGGDAEHTWDMAVNLAVGGDWAGDPDATTLGYLSGPRLCSRTLAHPPSNNPARCPTDAIMRAKFPSAMQVDYVRFYDPPQT